MEHSVKLEIEIKKISRRRSPSPDNGKFGHFKVVVLQRTQINLQRFITYLHSH